jgi:hypothetical protein
MTPACPCRTGSHVTGMDTQQADTAAVGMRGTERAIGSVMFDYLHVRSERAGPKVAAIVSVVETCRRLSISVREYLSEILPGLADYQRVSEFTPGRLKRSSRLSRAMSPPAHWFGAFCSRTPFNGSS